MISPCIVAEPSFSGSRIVSSSEQGVSSVTSVDLDSDGDIDLLTTASGSNAVVWHKNDGAQKFSIQTISTGAAAARHAISVDLDDDGDLDQ